MGEKVMVFGLVEIVVFAFAIWFGRRARSLAGTIPVINPEVRVARDNDLIKQSRNRGWIITIAMWLSAIVLVTTGLGRSGSILNWHLPFTLNPGELAFYLTALGTAAFWGTIAIIAIPKEGEGIHLPKLSDNGAYGWPTDLSARKLIELGEKFNDNLGLSSVLPFIAHTGGMVLGGIALYSGRSMPQIIAAGGIALVSGWIVRRSAGEYFPTNVMLLESKRAGAFWASDWSTMENRGPNEYLNVETARFSVQGKTAAITRPAAFASFGFFCLPLVGAWLFGVWGIVASFFINSVMGFITSLSSPVPLAAFKDGMKRYLERRLRRLDVTLASDPESSGRESGLFESCAEKKLPDPPYYVFDPAKVVQLVATRAGGWQADGRPSVQGLFDSLDQFFPGQEGSNSDVLVVMSELLNPAHCNLFGLTEAAYRSDDPGHAVHKCLQQGNAPPALSLGDGKFCWSGYSASQMGYGSTSGIQITDDEVLTALDADEHGGVYPVSFPPWAVESYGELEGFASTWGGRAILGRSIEYSELQDDIAHWLTTEPRKRSTADLYTSSALHVKNYFENFLMLPYELRYEYVQHWCHRVLTELSWIDTAPENIMVLREEYGRVQNLPKDLAETFIDGLIEKALEKMVTRPGAWRAGRVFVPDKPFVWLLDPEELDPETISALWPEVETAFLAKLKQTVEKEGDSYYDVIKLVDPRIDSNWSYRWQVEFGEPILRFDWVVAWPEFSHTEKTISESKPESSDTWSGWNMHDTSDGDKDEPSWSSSDLDQEPFQDHGYIDSTHGASGP